MNQPNLSNILADTFNFDFKAEVIAAELISSGVPPEQIMIRLLGSRKRSFRKDVGEVTDELSDYNNKEYTLISTHKEGIYDMLPEGLFHSPTLPKSATTQKEIIDNIKKHRIEERNARRFFMPYEAAINHLRIQMALYESKLDKGAHHSDLVDVFKHYWEIFKYLDTDQSNIFLQLIPLIHDARDNHEAVADIFEMMFSLQVTVKARRPQPVNPRQPKHSCLNDSLLGINFTTGNAIFDDGEDEIVVCIGPLTNQQRKTFMPGERNERVLELLTDYLLPVHVEIVREFMLIGEDRTTRLADGLLNYNSELGQSTYL